MYMEKNHNFTKILKKIHQNKWVAFTLDHKKIVAYSPSLISLEKEIGKKKVVYMKVPVSNTLFAF